MKTFDLANRPDTTPHRKKTTVGLAFLSEPFQVESQEGLVTVSPETVDDWDGGSYIAYPDDGSKPYAICPKFVQDNYIPAE